MKKLFLVLALAIIAYYVYNKTESRYYSCSITKTVYEGSVPITSEDRIMPFEVHRKLLNDTAVFDNKSYNIDTNVSRHSHGITSFNQGSMFDDGNYFIQFDSITKQILYSYHTGYKYTTEYKGVCERVDM